MASVAAEMMAVQFISAVRPSSRAAILPVSPRNWIVAWFGQAERANDRQAAVQADAESQRRSKFRFEFAAHPVDRSPHGRGGLQRIAGARCGVAVDA
jgi:hypothetical protein